MTKNKKNLIMIIVLLGYFIILVDTSLVFTCSKEIRASFDMDTALSAWISNAYALTFGSLLLLCGKLGDIYGRRRVFIIGLMIFGISSLAVGLSNSIAMLIICRAIQGIGAAIIAPATLAIIMDTFEGEARVKAISVYGTMSGIGVSLGLIIGAGITTLINWRWGFFVNVPIVFILIIMSLKILPQSSIKSTSLDYLGALLSFLAMVFIINGISGQLIPRISIITGLILLVCFIFREIHTSKPLLPMILLYAFQRNMAYLIRFAYSASITGFWFFTPLLLQAKFQMNPLIVGLSFLPMTVANFLSANQVNYLIAKIGIIKLMVIGLIITSTGFCWLMMSNYQNYWIGIAMPMLLIGIGQGFILSPVTNLATQDTPFDLSGVSSSIINVMLQIGGAFGLAILSNASSQFTNTVAAFHLQATGISIFSGLALVMAVILLIAKSVQQK